MAGSASRHSASPTAGPSAHGPTSRPSSPVSPLIPSPASATRQQHRRARPAPSPAARSAASSSSIASTRQNARLREHLAQAAPARRGGGTGGRCVSSRRLAWRRSPSASRHASRAVPASSGSPIHSGASSDAEHEPAADHEQVGQALAEPDDQVQQRAPGGAQVRREVERRGHDAASTVTSPLVLSAWIWNGASSTAVDAADARGARVALRVDLVAPGRHHRAHVAAARAQLQPVGRALGGGADVAGVRARAQREAAEAGRGDRARAGVDLHRRAHAGQRAPSRSRSRSRPARCRGRSAGRPCGRSRAPGPGSARRWSARRRRRCGAPPTARRTRSGRRAAPRPRWRRRRSPRRRRRGPAGCRRGRRARGSWSCASRA